VVFSHCEIDNATLLDQFSHFITAAISDKTLKIKTSRSGLFKPSGKITTALIPRLPQDSCVSGVAAAANQHARSTGQGRQNIGVTVLLKSHPNQGFPDKSHRDNELTSF
jgi:hypothetical protein